LNNINIKFYGELASQEVYSVMAKSDLLVVPSFSENSPNVIAEAQLLSLPVLASRVGGIPELIQHEVTGFLTEPDETSLTSELVKLCNRTDFSEVATAALMSAQGRWDNDINTISHIDIYKKVLNI
jgi:glycosyltransferase involved in cell wall biosynthesis